MKYSVKILAIVLAAGLAASCQREPQSFGFGISQNDIVMGADGGVENIEITSPGKWRAEVINTNEGDSPRAPWITLSPANGRGGKIECQIKVDSTLLAGNNRTAYVRFTSDEDGEELRLDVSQYGYDKMIVLSTTEVDIPDYAAADKRVFDVEVTSTVDFKMEIRPAKNGEQVPGIVDWIRNEDYDFDLDRGGRPRTVKLRFKWDSNIVTQDKEALVSFLPVNSGDVLERQDKLIVNQMKAPEITDDRRGDSMAMIFIMRALNKSLGSDEGENMNHWNFVRLWQAGDRFDKDDPDPIPAEVVGRIRRVEIVSFNTQSGEELPFQFKHLKWAEEIIIARNNNKFLKSLGTSVFHELVNLKRLTLDNIGISRLDPGFENLDKLEYLDLSGNNLDKVPEILTPENFENLEHLDLAGNVRYTIVNFKSPSQPQEKWGGLYIDIFPAHLLLWEKLTYLGLGNNYLRGEIPEMENCPKYTQTDPYFDGKGDTLDYAWQHELRRVLPNLKGFTINLNYMSGSLPDWLLYHPMRDKWSAETFVFRQKEGEPSPVEEIPSGFDNVPDPRDYYIAYPKKEPDYD